MKVKQIIKVAEAIDDSRKMPCDMHELEDTKYFSHSKQDFITIADMDIVHLVRAFKNDRHRLNNQITDKDLIRQNEDLVSANKTIARKHDIWKEKAMNMVEKSTHMELEMENQRLVQQLEHDETVVSKEAYQAMKERADLRSYEAYKYKKLAEDNFISSVNDSEDKDTWKKKYDDLKKKSEYDGLNVEGVRTMWEARYENEVNNSEFWKKAYMDYDKQPKGCGYVFSEIPNDTDGQEFVDNMKKYFNKKSYKMRVRGQHVKPELRGTGVTSHGQNIDESTHLRVYIEIK